MTKYTLSALSTFPGRTHHFLPTSHAKIKKARVRCEPRCSQTNLDSTFRAAEMQLARSNLRDPRPLWVALV